MSPIPLPFGYVPPFGTPLAWQDEQSGQLKAAILAYLDNRTKQTPLAEGDLLTVRSWLRYYIDAPCWELAATEPDAQADLKKLREQVRTLATADEIYTWIHKCLEMGIDPL